jgi:hypothetical protein
MKWIVPMLTWYCGPQSRDCTGLSRRDFVRIGALSLGSLALPQLLAAKEAAKQQNYFRHKSVVLLFLGGGPSHIETFNPNSDAPAPYCSITGEAKSSLPGVSFGGTFPLLAAQAHRMALVRSFTHPIGDHVKAIAHVLSGGTDPAGDGKAGYSMGSVFARIRGANHPESGLPTYSLLTSEEIDGQYLNERSRIANGSRPGTLGLANAPFDPNGGGTLLKNMQLKLAAERIDDRRNLLGQLDKLNRQVDSSGAMSGLDKFEQQALDMVLRGAGEAFDLKKEDKRLIERYDTSNFRVGKKVFQPSSLGKQMLLARRLVEAGCGFVTVQNSGWDMHADGNNPGVAAGMEMLGRPLDKAVSAFLEDLEQRGLSDDVLLIITGDFGRTPKVNKSGGRDHWARLCTLALAGGGLKMGQVIGQSSRQNDVPDTEPISTPQLMSTVLHTLFDVGQLRLDTRIPRELTKLAEDVSPISQLF